VDDVLREFPTYRNAAHCSVRWSEDHPARSQIGAMPTVNFNCT
jgi:hypothetical protein